MEFGYCFRGFFIPFLAVHRSFRKFCAALQRTMAAMHALVTADYALTIGQRHFWPLLTRFDWDKQDSAKPLSVHCQMIGTVHEFAFLGGTFSWAREMRAMIRWWNALMRTRVCDYDDITGNALLVSVSFWRVGKRRLRGS